MIRTALLILALASSLLGQARTGSVSGRILSPDGTPAVGVRVSALQAGDMMGGSLTDGNGRYELKDLATGRYVIAAGLIGSFTYSPGTPDETKALAVDVRANSVTPNIDFKLAIAAGVRIRGIVAAAAGNFPPARSATLMGRRADNTDIDFIHEVVRPDGSFEFRGVPPGEYTLEFSPSGQDLHLKVGNTNLDDVRIKAPIVVTGRVFIEDGGPLLTSPSQVRAAAVMLSFATSTPDVGGLSDHFLTNNGTASFALPAGHQYQVEMFNVPFGYYVKSIRSGTLDLLSSKLDVDNGATTRNIDVVLTAQRPATEPAGVTVRGRVTSSTPLPAGTQASMTMTPALSYHAVPVQTDGSFVFRNVPAGPYTLQLNTMGLITNKSFVVRDTDIDDIAFTVAGQLMVKVRVNLERQNETTPRPPFLLRFYRTDGFSRSLAVGRETFEVALLEGTYQLLLTDLPLTHIVKSIMYGTQDASRRMILDANRTSEELVITLQEK